MWACAILICSTAPLSEYNVLFCENFFRFFDRIDLNFNAINLKDQDKFFYSAKILPHFNRNSQYGNVQQASLNELISRKLYFSAILECGMAFTCVIWTHEAKRKTMKNRWHINMAEKYYFRNINSLRVSVVHFNIAQTHIFLSFQYCLNETIYLPQYKGAPVCLL